VEHDCSVVGESLKAVLHVSKNLFFEMKAIEADCKAKG
jgi:hypothetical protein